LGTSFDAVIVIRLSQQLILHVISKTANILLMKSTTFLNMAPSSVEKVHKRFGETYCLNLQGRRVRHATRKNQANMLVLLFHPEDGGSKFPRHVDGLLPQYSKKEIEVEA
jgi:hypothetical protein